MLRSPLIPAVLLLCFAGCAAAGAFIEDGGTAAAVVGTTEFFGPGIGWLSSFLWKLLFGWTASEVTGTTSTRVDAAGKEISGVGSVGNPLEMNMFDSPLFWFVATALFLSLGGPAWLRGAIKRAKDEARESSSKLEQKVDRLEGENAQLRREIDKLWKNWNSLG